MQLTITERHCFYPDAVQYSTPLEWGLQYDSIRFQGPAGELTGWHIHPSAEAAPKNVTVLHLHGNAQNMSAHLYGAYFLALEGFRLITFDYRGYGDSEGKPSLAGIIDDAALMTERVLNDPPGQSEPLAVFGQSMGAFTAAHLLPRFEQGIARCIMEAGLVSFHDLFKEAYPAADVRVPQGFSTLEPLSRSQTPKLFIHGTMDSVVPLSHSERMHQAAAPPKELLTLPGVGHIDALHTPQAEAYRRYVVNFLGS